MSRHFLANLSFLFLLNIAVKPLYILGIEVNVQNTLGTGTYGLYFAILNTAYLLQILNDFGLQIYNNRQVASDSGSSAWMMQRLAKLKLLLSGIFVITFLLVAEILGYGGYREISILVAANLVLMSLVLFLRSGISGLGLYKTDSLLSIFDKAVLIVLCGYLLIFETASFTLFHFLFAQMASLGAAAIVASVILLRKRIPPMPQGSPKIPLRSLISQASPYALAVFLMSIYTRVDAVMIEQIAVDGKYQSGLYAAGYRLLDAANMFAYLFAILLLPMFVRIRDRPTETTRLISQASRLMWILTITAACLCFGFSEDIMTLFYTAAQQQWAETFGILFFSFIGVGMMYVFGTFLTALGEMRLLNWIYLSCVVLNIALNAVLIPRQGATGAAIATLITQTAVAILLTRFALKHAAITLNPTSIILPLLFAVGNVAILYSINSLGPDISWMLRAGLFAILSIATAFVLKLFRASDLRAIFAR